MNRHERYNNDKNWNRASDINVDESTTKAIQKIALAHLAAGSYDGYKLAMGSLSKFNEQREIAELKEQIGAILAKLA